MPEICKILSLTPAIGWVQDASLLNLRLLTPVAAVNLYGDDAMQLQYLTQSHVRALFSACGALESEYVTRDSGEIDRASASTEATYRTARSGLSAALQSIPDAAMIELQALALFGRGDSGSDLAGNLTYSAKRFDASTREYLASKSPLRQYIESGLQTSGAKLAY